jgi:hypothetical protein
MRMWHKICIRFFSVKFLFEKGFALMATSGISQELRWKFAQKGKEVFQIRSERQGGFSNNISFAANPFALNCNVFSNIKFNHILFICSTVVREKCIERRELIRVFFKRLFEKSQKRICLSPDRS